MAKKKKVSAKQRAAAKRNIKKAIAANRRKGRTHTKSPRRRMLTFARSGLASNCGLRTSRADNDGERHAGRRSSP